MTKPVKLTEEQFWRWSHRIEELNHSKAKVALSRTQIAYQDKSLECEQLKKQLLQSQLKEKMQGYTAAENTYNKEKEQLEAELGFSLNNTAINTETREVKVLTEDKPKKPSKAGG